MVRFFTFLFGISFSLVCFSADLGCEGRMRDVLPLGGNEQVLTVEAINAERSAELTRYTGDLSVQELLRAEGRYGFVAIRNERVVGFVVYEKRGQYVQVISIGVAKDAQGQGVGRDLIESTVASAKQMPGIKDVRVMLRMEDEDSHTFFGKVQFVDAEIIAGRFDAQTHKGRLMKLSLGGNPGTSPALYEPRLQLAPQPQIRRASVTTAVLPATREFLHRIDPTLQNAD